MKENTQNRSGTLYEALLRTLAAKDSLEAVTQLAVLCNKNGNQDEAQSLLKRAFSHGDHWAGLELCRQKLRKARKEQRHTDIEDIKFIAGEFNDLFYDAISEARLPQGLIAEAWHTLRLFEPDLHEKSRQQLRSVTAACCALDEYDLFDAAKIILKSLAAGNAKLPEYLAFLKDTDADLLSPAMAVHDLAAAVEHGDSGLKGPSPEAAPWLYATALRLYALAEHEQPFEEGVEQDQDYFRDDLIEQLVLLNDLAMVAKNHPEIGLDEDCADACALEAAVTACKMIIMLREHEPDSPFIRRLIKLLEYMSERGSTRAAEMLFALAKEGKSVKKSEEQVTKFLKRLAEEGDVCCQVLYAQRLISGTGTPKNPRKAREMYSEAAKFWNKDAMAVFARDYAAQAQKGSQAALLRRGHCLEFGLGFQKNPQRAFECYQKLDDPLLRNARIACLKARCGDREQAQKYLKRAEDQASGFSDPYLSFVWKSYLEACDCECGITKDADKNSAGQLFTELTGSELTDREDNDLFSHINLKTAYDLADPEHPQELCEDDLKGYCDEYAQNYEDHGDPLEWADSIVSGLTRLPAFIEQPDADAPSSASQREAAAALGRLMPDLHEYVFDTRLTFMPGCDTQEKQEQAIRKAIREGARITLDTCTLVTSEQGGLGSDAALRYCVLSKGFDEITDPAYAALKAAAIPAGEKFQVLGVHQKDGKYLVILLHDPDDALLNFRSDAGEESRALIKPLCDRFDTQIKAKISMDFIKDLLPAAGHISLGKEHSGDFTSYFASSDGYSGFYAG